MMKQRSESSGAPHGAYRRVVFSDFDGTISAIETFSAMLKRFTPKVTAEVLPQLYDGSLCLREGIRRLIETIPSDRYPEILSQVREAGLRPGLEQLIDFLDARDVPFVVISGGLHGMVESALGPLVHRVRAIHAMEVDTEGPFLRVSSRFENETEIVAKPAVMELYPAQETVALGDAITDASMARAATLVFARDWLAEHLQQHGLPFQSWETFFDVRDELLRRWGDNAL